ncbi:hypothetical protein RRG08_062188 [Elysia crispata]|uniref:Sodefrin-like factor n=1 Tax=Elysia crispata TaxID=231223 RepID=A0AAE0YBL4_9GAST|nr:hypothetical protein RRG08_062188 [Elysia crispata]
MANYVYFLLVLLIWFWSAPLNEGTLCLFCQSGVQDFSQCTKVGQCTGDQVCITEKYDEGGGIVTWYSGCQNREVCRRLGAYTKRSAPDGGSAQPASGVPAHFGARASRQLRPGQNVCSGCCDDTDFCNARECGFNADFQAAGFRTCFKCDGVPRPTDCDHVIQCTDQERISLLYPSVALRSYFTKGEQPLLTKWAVKKPRQMCEAYDGYLQYFTKRRAVSTGDTYDTLSRIGIRKLPVSRSGDIESGTSTEVPRSKRTIDDPRALCLTCGAGDFCNRLQDCGSVLTSSTTSLTSSTAVQANGQFATSLTPSTVFQGVLSTPSLTPSTVSQGVLSTPSLTPSTVSQGVLSTPSLTPSTVSQGVLSTPSLTPSTVSQGVLSTPSLTQSTVSQGVLTTHSL